MKKTSFHKSPEFIRHLKRYLQIAKLLFALAFIAHVTIIIVGLRITVGDFVVPQFASYLFAFIAFAMMFMAGFYRKHLRVEKYATSPSSPNKSNETHQ